MNFLIQKVLADTVFPGDSGSNSSGGGLSIQPPRLPRTHCPRTSALLSIVLQTS